MRDEEAVKVAITVCITRELERESQRAIDWCRKLLGSMGDPVERERREHERRTVAEGDRLLGEVKGVLGPYELENRVAWRNAFFAEDWAPARFERDP